MKENRNNTDMLSLDSGEDMGGVEAAGPFRLSDLAL